MLYRYLRNFCRNIFYQRRVNEDLDQEIRSYAQLVAEAKAQSGISGDEALRQTYRELGGVERIKENVRDVRVGSYMDSLLQDLRYATRVFRRSPGFTAAAVFALGLGVGVNTAVFTAFQSMVARLPDAWRPQEIVNLSLLRKTGAPSFTFSYPDYEVYRQAVRSFSGVIAFSQEPMRFSHSFKSRGDKPAVVDVSVVSSNYFRVLGIEPVRGRGFHDGPLPAFSALISQNCWEKKFSSNPAILGRTVYLNGIGFTVVGMTPRNFVGTSVAAPDFWLPLATEPQVHFDSNWLRDRENERYRLFARLAPGATLQSAQLEMNLVANRLRALHDPHSDAAKPATAMVSPGSPFPLPLSMYPGLRFAILLIFCAAGIVLLVACANVGSLQLARARSRQNELHTRLSLGAGRARLIRQLLTESALLGLLAGTAALFCTWAFLKMIVFYGVRALPEEAGTLILDVAPDLRTILFVFSVSLLAGFLFGLAPALENSRHPLSSSSRNNTSGVRARRLQDLLITAQVALSLVLLISGSMLIHGALRSLELDTGYQARRVIDLQLQFPEGPKYKAEGQSALIQELRRRLAALPGVAGVTSARSRAYLSFQTAVFPLGANHQTLAPSFLYYTYVEPKYFELLSIPLAIGHTFRARSGQPENSVILSKSAAQQLWPGKNPVGRRLRLAALDEKRHNTSELAPLGPTYEVIGVAGDTRGVAFDRSDSKQVYLPLPQNLLTSRSLLIRADTDAVGLKRAVETLVSSLDPDIIPTTSTLQELLRQTLPFITASLGAAIASVIGFAGLLLCLMGIYGTISYIVALRTRELGIRIAIGAQRGDILRLILSQSARPVLTGITTGIFLAVGASYLLRSALYGLNLIDPLAFGGTSFVFLAIALAAAYPPSRRAMRVDPAVALRYE